MADNLRSSDPTPKTVLGNKATGGVDGDQDHVPNVVSGLKGTLNNDNTSAKAKKDAEEKLEELQEFKEQRDSGK